MANLNRNDIYEVVKVGLLAKNSRDLSAITDRLLEATDDKDKQRLAKRLIIKWQTDLETAVSSHDADDARRFINALTIAAEVKDHDAVLLCLDTHDDLIRLENIRRAIQQVFADFPPRKKTTVEDYLQVQGQIGELKDQITTVEKEIKDLPGEIKLYRNLEKLFRGAAYAWPVVTLIRKFTNDWTLGQTLGSLLIWVTLFMFLSFLFHAIRKESIQSRPKLPLKLAEKRDEMEAVRQRLIALAGQLPELGDVTTEPAAGTSESNEQQPS